jgi:hypothetical protein
MKMMRENKNVSIYGAAEVIGHTLAYEEDQP